MARQMKAQIAIRVEAEEIAREAALDAYKAGNDDVSDALNALADRIAKISLSEQR